MSTLLIYRRFRRFSMQYVAQKLGISVPEYKGLESGLEIPDAEIAQKLSDLYQAPFAIFMILTSKAQNTIVYSHCDILGPSGYNNFYGACCDCYELLYEQLKKLSEGNNTLIELVKKIARYETY